MIEHIRNKIHDYWYLWINKRSALTNPQILSQQNIYILPSGFGWIYGLLLLSLFSGAINYQISTVFLMTFLLAVIGLVSAWEAHGNLKELSIKLISIEDAQQGKPAQITLLIHSSTAIRFGLSFQLINQPPTRLEQIPPEGIQFILPIETEKRGYFPLPRITISSLFPFGIFRVWGYARFDAHYYVYPTPISPEFWPNPVSNQNKKIKHTSGVDEFYDLKQVENPWLQPNLIAWKIAAKEQGWYVKTRDSNEGEFWLFSLNDLPANTVETKLQHLSYWLIHSELNHYIYGLELAKSPIHFARGKEHLQHCLRQLALY